MALSYSALPVAAQPVVELDEISATASLENVDINRTGVTVDVIDAQDLAKFGDARVSDVLQSVSGITVRSQGPAGTQTGIQIRGASQNYIAVYVDGIEVSDPSGTQVAYDFGGLTAADIGRIEILKGSQSAIFGSRAVGGVISITTKRAEKIGKTYSAEVEYGSYNTVSGSLSYAAKSDKGEAAITVSRITSDGYSAADENDGNTEADGFEKSRVSFYSHRDLASGVRIGASGFAEISKGEFDDYGPVDEPVPHTDYTDNKSSGLRSFAEFTSGAVDNLFELTWFDITRDSHSAYGVSSFDGSRAKARYQGGIDLGADSHLAFGADYTREDASDDYGFSGDNEVLGLFSEINHAPNDKTDLTAALRYDDHSEFGGHLTGRFAIAYRPRTDVTIRSAIGTGFRAPSTYELYSAYGDPTLDPEESVSADLGVEKRFAGGSKIQLTLFYLKVDNLIDFDYAATACGSGFGCYAQVSGTSERSGVELTGTKSLGEHTDLTGSYTYTDSSTNASSSWAEVPRDAVDLTLASDLSERTSATVNLHYAANRQSGLDDYAVMNASLTRKLRKGAEVYLRIENVTNEQYELVPGYGTSDRAYYVGLRASL